MVPLVDIPLTLGRWEKSCRTAGGWATPRVWAFFLWKVPKSWFFFVSVGSSWDLQQFVPRFGCFFKVSNFFNLEIYRFRRGDLGNSKLEISKPTNKKRGELHPGKLTWQYPMKNGSFHCHVSFRRCICNYIITMIYQLPTSCGPVIHPQRSASFLSDLWTWEVFEIWKLRLFRRKRF